MRPAGTPRAAPGRYAEGGQPVGCIGHEAVGAADEHLPFGELLDLCEVLIAESSLEPLPVRIGLAEDQGEGHSLLRHGVQLAGGRNIRLAAT